MAFHITGQISRMSLRCRSAGLSWTVDFHDHTQICDDALTVERPTPALARSELLNIQPGASSLTRQVLFDEIATDALRRSKETKARKGHKSDRYLTRILLSWFGGRLASEITANEIAACLAELAEEGRSTATLQHYRSLLSVIFLLGMRNGKVSTNPASEVPLQPVDNGRIRFLTDEEETRLRASIREAVPARESEFDLALNTGMRRGEQYGLTWGDVDLDAAVLQIQRSKNGRPRKIFLNSAALAAIERLLELNDRSDLVCLLGSGQWFEKALQSAEITDFRWHDLRHTFASRLVMAGVDLRTVQELLGHWSFAATLRYVHLAPQHLHGAVEQLCQEEACA